MNYEIFSPSFVENHTSSKYKNIHDFVSAYGNPLDEVTINENIAWNNFVSKNTDFSSWSEMLSQAQLEQELT